MAAGSTYKWEKLVFSVDWVPILGLCHLAEFGEVVQNSLKASNPLNSRFYQAHKPAGSEGGQAVEAFFTA